MKKKKKRKEITEEKKRRRNGKKHSLSLSEKDPCFLCILERKHGSFSEIEVVHESEEKETIVEEEK